MEYAEPLLEVISKEDFKESAWAWAEHSYIGIGNMEFKRFFGGVGRWLDSEGLC